MNFIISLYGVVWTGLWSGSQRFAIPFEWMECCTYKRVISSTKILILESLRTHAYITNYGELHSIITEYYFFYILIVISSSSLGMEGCNCTVISMEGVVLGWEGGVTKSEKKDKTALFFRN